MKVKNKGAFDFFSKPSNYLNNNYSIEIRKNILSKSLIKENNYSILDLGCGDGSLSLPLLNKLNKLVCVDFSIEMLSIIERKVPAEFKDKIDVVHANITDFDYKDKFDVILCFGVLAHVSSIKNLIEVIKNHSKSGTRVFVQFSDTNSCEHRLRSLFINKKPHSTHYINRMKGKEIKRMFNNECFVILKQTKYFGSSLGFTSISGTFGAFVQNFISKFSFFVGENIIEFELK